MKIRTISDLSNHADVDFLKRGLSLVTEEHLLVNYHPDYADNTGNLFYILKYGRFSNSSYYVMETDLGEFAGSAGWNPMDSNIALGLVRAYIPKQFRAQFLMAEHLLPKILEETANYSKLWITFNEYNLRIYNGLKRMSENKPSGVAIPWPRIYSKFKPIGMHQVNNTSQYVAEYERHPE